MQEMLKKAKTLQKTFITDLSADLISRISSLLSLIDFHRFQRTSKKYFKAELYNEKFDEKLESNFDLILNSENCPNPDEILANIVKKGRKVGLSRDQKLQMINNSYSLLFEALMDRELVATDLNQLLADSVKSANLWFCKRLLQLRANSSYFVDGSSLLMTACEAGNLDLAKLLVLNFSDLDYYNELGLNALLCSFQDNPNRAAIVNYLLDSGAIVAKDEGSILHLATIFRDLPLYQRLLDPGVDSSLTNDSDMTAIDCLLEACSRNMSDFDLNAAIDAAIKIFKPINSEQRLLNEGKIIQTLLSPDKLRKVYYRKP